MLAEVTRSGRRLLPVDSEHSALLQCTASDHADAILSLVLTASGGPFRGRTTDDLRDVGPADALAHPTWDMGAKITIDSATLMNKGLEVIEAHFLFGLPYDRIEVVVHPQSIVHGMARMRDGALIAHVGHPDMRVPISYALTYPDRSATPRRSSTCRSRLSLTFEPPDTDTFRCLALARAAGEAGGTAPCVLNAANEEAVAAFLAGRDRLPRHRRAGRRRARRRAGRARSTTSRPCARPTRRRAPPSPTGWEPSHEPTSSRSSACCCSCSCTSSATSSPRRASARGPRSSTSGSRPPSSRHRRGETEYGIGSIPLGGYVKIVGMARPQPVDLWRIRDAADEAQLRRTEDGADELTPAVDALERALKAGRLHEALPLTAPVAEALDRDAELLQDATLPPGPQGSRADRPTTSTRAPTGRWPCGAASSSSPPARSPTSSPRS